MQQAMYLPTDEKILNRNLLKRQTVKRGLKITKQQQFLCFPSLTFTGKVKFSYVI